ncbi:MAG: indolepyruvate oxidoreductase subunit beta [Dissulfuribacterales bacterium]
MKRMKLLFVGVGGQGTLLASRLLGEACMKNGISVLLSEVHGMAQRGGVVESTVMLGGLKSPLISLGEADVLIGFEPLETLRAISYCNKDSVVITSLSPIVPNMVKLGASQYPDINSLFNEIKGMVAGFYACDAEELANKIGSPKSVNVLLLGMLMGTGLLPVSMESMEDTIRTQVKPKTVDANLNAFMAGVNLVS